MPIIACLCVAKGLSCPGGQAREAADASSSIVTAVVTLTGLLYSSPLVLGTDTTACSPDTGLHIQQARMTDSAAPQRLGVRSVLRRQMCRSYMVATGAGDPLHALQVASE